MRELVENEQFLLQLTSHQRRLIGYVRTLVPNRADAEELLQEINLYLCRHAGDFQPGTNFAAWALRVAHFCVLTWRGRQSRDRLIFDESLLVELAESAEGFDRGENRYQVALESCLSKLRPAESELIRNLYNDPAATPRSVAEQAGKSAKGIYVLLRRIRLALLECIQRTLAAEDRAR